MIPYIHVPDLSLGPLTLHPFGLLVATGVIIGTALATRRATRLNVDLDKLNSFITWMLVGGFVCAHMLDTIFYHPDELAKRPWSIFLLWEGLSSFGGFLGALLGVLAWKYFEARPVANVGGMTFSRIGRRTIAQPILPLCDIILAVFPVAWIFGRSGCSVVHDHPGAHAPADALLAVAYGPQHIPPTTFGPIQFLHGTTPQWDLGLLELMFTIILAGCLAMTWGRKLPTGTYVAVTCMAYAPVRLAMDFLRIQGGESADPRYGGLTPAQWGCFGLFFYGVAILIYSLRLKARGIELLDAVRAPTIADPIEAIEPDGSI